VHRLLSPVFINFQLVAFCWPARVLHADLFAINTRSRSIRERASKRTYLTRHCVQGFNCSLSSLTSAALVQQSLPHYLSARIKCGDGRRRRWRLFFFSVLFELYRAMFILQSEMNTVHKKGTVGSGPRAGQAPQVAVSPTHSLSTLHRAPMLIRPPLWKIEFGSESDWCVYHL
jgi:hypothetical protein